MNRSGMNRSGINRWLLFLAVAVLAHAADFTPHTIATGLKDGYQVVIADLNHDGKPDLIALASGMDDLVWFENPGWQRHVLIRGMKGMINCAALDVDGDGIPEIVLASGFAGPGQSSTGVLTLLHHNGDPRELWTATEIDRVPMSHRLRWAKPGNQPVLINAPLTADRAQPPDFPGRVPIVSYEPGVWKRKQITDADTGLVHGIFVLDWDGDGHDEVLTAGFDGIHLLKLEANKVWTRQQLAHENSSDVAVGRLGNTRYLCAIQPWHGNTVAVYRLEDGQWRRNVIDESLVDGHTILTADFEGNGRDTIVAGFRGGKRSVYLYSAEDANGTKWTRRALDEGGMGAAACAIADIDGDGHPDVVCIGSATENLKWYRNSIRPLAAGSRPTRGSRFPPRYSALPQPSPARHPSLQ